jgi:hypothetical protein
VLFAVLTFLIKGPIGYAAGSLSTWLRHHRGVQIRLYRAAHWCPLDLVFV